MINRLIVVMILKLISQQQIRVCDSKEKKNCSRLMHESKILHTEKYTCTYLRENKQIKYGMQLMENI